MLHRGRQKTCRDEGGSGILTFSIEPHLGGPKSQSRFLPPATGDIFRCHANEINIMTSAAELYAPLNVYSYIIFLPHQTNTAFSFASGSLSLGRFPGSWLSSSRLLCRQICLILKIPIRISTQLASMISAVAGCLPLNWRTPCQRIA